MGRAAHKCMRSVRLAMAEQAVEMGQVFKVAARIAEYANTSALPDDLSARSVQRSTCFADREKCNESMG